MFIFVEHLIINVSKKYYLIIIVLLLATFAAQAQYLRGTVVDKDTGETLPGATLYIDGTTVATATDGNGN